MIYFYEHDFAPLDTVHLTSAEVEEFWSRMPGMGAAYFLFDNKALWNRLRACLSDTGNRLKVLLLMR